MFSLSGSAISSFLLFTSTGLFSISAPSRLCSFAAASPFNFHLSFCPHSEAIPYGKNFISDNFSQNFKNSYYLYFSILLIQQIKHNEKNKHVNVADGKYKDDISHYVSA